MIRTRYCPANRYEEFRAKLEDEGCVVTKVTTVAGVSQVTFEVPKKVNDIASKVILKPEYEHFNIQE